VERSLSDLLAEWGDERTVALAQAIDDRTAALLADTAMPAPIHDRDFHRMWIDATKDPVRRGWAAPRLRDRLPGAQPTHRLDALAKRIEALATRGPDPRTSYAVASAILADPDVLLYRRVLDAAVHALGESGDPRSDQLLADAAAAAPEGIELLRSGIQAYRGAKPPKPVLGPAEYAVRVEATPAIEDLWRQLAANPGDDTTRAVLGDALLANGDPRGELFALQLAHGTDAERRARIAALVQRFGDRWSGRLKGVATHVVFRRGAPVAIAMRPGASPAVDELVHDPVLATIEVVVPNGASDDVYLQLITSPAMASLHSVEVRSTQIAASVAALSAPVRHVSLAAAAIKRSMLRDCVRACAARVSIRSASIYATIYDTFAKTGWLDHLTALTIGGRMRDALAIWPRLPRAIELSCVISTTPLTLRPEFFDQIVLRRDGASTVARVLGSWLLQPLDPLLGAIPKLTRVEIAGDEQLANRLRTELRGVEVVTVDPPDRGQSYVYEVG
jgi:uncharacterized protein (TIGR02996 family)